MRMVWDLLSVILSLCLGALGLSGFVVGLNCSGLKAFLIRAGVM